MDDIRKKARQRAEERKLPYAGAVTPAEAHTLMQAGAKLIDVRTDAEVHYVGAVPGGDHIEWSNFPDGQRNPDFVKQLENTAKKEDTVMFLCRSGARSHNAAIAATQAGFKDAYNILEGFEGDKDAEGHRSSVGGWRFAGLPWIQS